VRRRPSRRNACAAAARYYGEALELWPPDSDGRPSLLLSLGRARFVLGHDSAERTLEEAREALLASEQRAQAGVAEAILAEIWWFRGNRDRCDLYLERAHAHVADLPPSNDKAHVLAQASRFHAIAGDNAGAIRIGGEALAIAELLQLAEVQAQALISIGWAKGGVDAIEDLERALAIALAARSPQAVRAAHNLGAAVSYLGDIRRGEPLFDEAIRIAEEFGYRLMARFSRGEKIELLFWLGRWAEAMTLAEDAIAERATGDGHPQEHRLRRRRAFVRLARGDTDGALDDVRVMLELAREVKDPQSLHPALAGGARIYANAGRIEEARALAAELVATFRDAADWFLVEAAWVAEELGYAEELRRLFEEVPNRTAWGRAGLALLDGNYEAAAEAFAETGDMESEAAARLRAGEKLFAEGRRAEADEQLVKALAFFRSVDATRYIREAEALLSAPVESRSQ